MDIIRVCGAILREDKILMVLHKYEGGSHWTLPGGAVEQNETIETAVIREVYEETELKTEVMKPLFDENFKGGLCRCFLIAETKQQQIANLGYDPEELDLPQEEKVLQKVEWKSLEKLSKDIQVAKVLSSLAN